MKRRELAVAGESKCKLPLGCSSNRFEYCTIGGQDSLGETVSFLLPDEANEGFGPDCREQLDCFDARFRPKRSRDGVDIIGRNPNVWKSSIVNRDETL